MAYRVTVKGVPQALAYFQALGRNVPNRMRRDGLNEISRLVVDNARWEQLINGTPTAPVHPTRLTTRTAKLRDSITANKNNLPARVTVGSDVAYARKHELGEGIAPRPFLQPAAEAINPRIINIFNKYMTREIESNG